LGPSDIRHVAVIKGLTPGQLVVTDGADRLKDGAKVRLLSAAPRGAGAPGAAQPAATPDHAQPPETDRPHKQRRRSSE